MNNADVALVSVISLGGTITMVKPGSGQGVVPTLDAQALLATVPELATVGARIAAHSFRSLPGAGVGFGDLTELVALIESEISRGAHGIVVIQGTDTIEETSFFLDVAVRSEVPIVVTGAMRNPTMAGADGPANLLAAVCTAASEDARGLGSVVVLFDEIHAARFVRKTHSTSTGAFSSPNAGPIGRVVEGRASILVRPKRGPFVAPTAKTPHVRVAVVHVSLGDDGEQVRRLGDHFDGIVVAGFGAGHVPAAMVQALTEQAARIPVVLTSRCTGGPVLHHTYGFPGSEQDLLNRGLIGAEYLDPFKARILLQLLLGAGKSQREILSVFSAS